MPATGCWACTLVGLLVGGARPAAPSEAAPHRPAAVPRATVTVSYLPGHPVNTFVPSEALGAGIDGHEKGDTARMLTPANVRAMLSAGLKPLTYRLRTELGIEAWHWNPRGSWSSPARREGYWTSADDASAPIDVCHGYRLPRRGSTVDQANNDGYSRIDDGDTGSYWKSNPYLDRHYTGEDNALHPQWVLVDFGRLTPVNTIRIAWGVPWAVRYRVEYSAERHPEDIADRVPARWRSFPNGTVPSGSGGLVTLRLCQGPVRARFVRIAMSAGSGTAHPGSRDVRDRLGYAIRELWLGTTNAAGRFRDALRHSHAHGRQTPIYASSTDPWHRASDLDPDVEQPGFDLVERTGLTSGLPMLTPVALLYDTPDNAAAQVRFLRRRGYNVRQIEMGEEPDGQYVTPEDYGALFIQFADAVHKVDPTLKLGGPCFQTTIAELNTWPSDSGDVSWMARFVRYLQRRGRMGDWTFFSFEWYPFDDTRAPTAPQLARAPELLAGVLQRMQRDGLPASIPWMITEYGYSAFSGRPEVDMEGALFNAETVALFLTLGGDAAYLYGYEPNELIEESPGAWGNNMNWLADRGGRARWPMPTYWAARLISREWAQPGQGKHALYAASSDARDPAGRPLVTAYAVLRPDGGWSVMLLNKDPVRTWSVTVQFRDPDTDAGGTLRGTADLYQYSRAQYLWHPDGERGRPLRDLPPAHTRVRAEAPATLPPYSLTVLRAAGPPG